MNLLIIWLLIVGLLALFAAAIVPATAAVAEETHQKILRLMDAHERNLRSGDPAVVESSKRRWEGMCRFLETDHRTYRTATILREFGGVAG